MSWEDLWAFYKAVTVEIQNDILKQLNLLEFVDRLSPKYQKEILQHAPESVRNMIPNDISHIPNRISQLLDRNGMVMK
jgi:hypothetical protein